MKEKDFFYKFKVLPQGRFKGRARDFMHFPVVLI